MEKIIRHLHRKRDSVLLAFIIIAFAAPAAHAGWLDPLKTKAKEAIDPIAFIGFCYGCAKLYSKDYVAAILALAASILLFSADTILSSLH